jgi:predicted naringenin-chalcone synthase
MKPTAYIHGIATAVPRCSLGQDVALAFMLRHLRLDDEQRRFLRRLYAASGIDRRHSVIEHFAAEPAQFRFFAPNETLLPQPSTAQRNTRFASHANELGSEALRKLFECCSLMPDCITHLVTASCTGFSAPGFDCHMIQALGLNPAVQRFHLGFMGCFAAFPALRLADHICRSTPGARVAVVTLELCTLHFTAAVDAQTLVTQSLFSDGGAAVLVSADRNVTPQPLYALRRFASRLLPDSAEEMSWVIGDHGFEMTLTAQVPRLIEHNVCTVLEELCRASDVETEAVRQWAIHPGGRAILDKTADALGRPREELGASYRVLREHGNMSASTVLYVLDEIARNGRPGPVFGAAFGPGLTVESALFDRL